MKTNDLSGRVHLIDELRGAAILLMVLYHGAYDLVAIFGLDFPFFYSAPVNFTRDVMAGTFILISGCACRFSRSNSKRGLITLGLGFVMTAVTALALPSQVIRFGVLHCLGACMLLFSLLRRPLDKLSPTAGALVCGIVFYCTYTVPKGAFGGITYFTALPRSLYGLGFLYPLGFPSESFFSSDYYPLIPWFFLFLCGAAVGVLLKERRFPSWIYESHAKPLAAVGRHTLLIYVLHQPVLYGVLSLLFGALTR